MSWTTILAVGGAVLGLVALKRLSFVPVKAARAYLDGGAEVVDVRTPGEFESGHLKSAVNVPLGDLVATAKKRFQDKDKPLLLHCHSGARSGIARRRLQSLGYSKVYNLGSYRRAEKILMSRPK